MTTETLTHVIRDIRMRQADPPCWVVCSCGWRGEAPTAEILKIAFGLHRADSRAGR